MSDLNEGLERWNYDRFSKLSVIKQDQYLAGSRRFREFFGDTRANGVPTGNPLFNDAELREMYPPPGQDLDDELAKLKSKYAADNRAKGRRQDLFIYGATGLLALADLIKNIVAGVQSEHPTTTQIVGGVGDLEAAVAAALASYRTAKSTDTFVALYPMILAAMAAIVGASEQLAGFGEPDPGTSFTVGSRQCTLLRGLFRTADPDPAKWSGEAAAAYAALNADQRGLVVRMASLDAQMAAVVKDQADTVNQIRQGLGSTKTALATLALLCGITAKAVAADVTGAARRRLSRIIGVSGGTVLMLLVCLGLFGLLVGGTIGDQAAVVREDYQAVAADALSWA